MGAVGAGSAEALRGGSWYNLARDERAADRGGVTPDGRDYGLGVRLSRTAP